jgi:hypothetical protein
LKKNRQLVACTAHIPTTFSHWKSGWSVLNQEKLIFNHILTKKKNFKHLVNIYPWTLTTIKLAPKPTINSKLEFFSSSNLSFQASLREKNTLYKLSTSKEIY